MPSPFRNFAFGFLAAVLLAATFVSAAPLFSCGATFSEKDLPTSKAHVCYGLNLGDTCTDDLGKTGTCTEDPAGISNGVKTGADGRIFCVCQPSGSSASAVTSAVSSAATTASTAAKVAFTGLTLYNMNKFGFYSTDEDKVKFTYKIGEKEEATFDGFAPFLNLPNEGKLGNEIGVVSLSGCEVDSSRDTTGICKLVREKLAGSGGFVAKLDAAKKTLSIGLKNPTAAATPVKAKAAAAGLITFASDSAPVAIDAASPVAGTAAAPATTASTVVETTSEDTAKMAQIAAAGYLYSLADGSHSFTLDGYDCISKGSDEFVLAVACSKKLKETKTGPGAAPVTLNPEAAGNFKAMLDAALAADAKQGQDMITVTRQPVPYVPIIHEVTLTPPAPGTAQEPPKQGAAETVAISKLYTDETKPLELDKAQKIFLTFTLSSACKSDGDCTYSFKIGDTVTIKEGSKLPASDNTERHITIELTEEQEAALKTGSLEAIMALKRKAADGKETSVEGKATVKITETAETKKPKVGAPAPEKKPAKSVPSSGKGSGSSGGAGSGGTKPYCQEKGLGKCKASCLPTETHVSPGSCGTGSYDKGTVCCKAKGATIKPPVVKPPTVAELKCSTRAATNCPAPCVKRESTRRCVINSANDRLDRELCVRTQGPCVPEKCGAGMRGSNGACCIWINQLVCRDP